MISRRRSPTCWMNSLLEVFPTIRAGDLERQVHARLVESCLRHGFGWVHGILNSSSNHVMYGGESDLLFRQGDFVRNDYVAYLNGYAGHQSRLAILGEPSSAQRKGYDLTLDVHRKTIERCHAGVTAGEIYAFVVDAFKKEGIDYTASLVGHGMGPWFHQQEPVLRKNSDIILEDGMVLAVEPQRQHWHIQDSDRDRKRKANCFPTNFPLTRYSSSIEVVGNPFSGRPRACRTRRPPRQEALSVSDETRRKNIGHCDRIFERVSARNEVDRTLHSRWIH